MASLEDLKGKLITYKDGEDIECTGHFYGYYPLHANDGLTVTNILILTRQAKGEDGKTAVYGMEWTDGDALPANILAMEDVQSS